MLALPDTEAKILASEQLRRRGFKGLISATYVWPEEQAPILAAGADITYNYFAEAGVGLAADTFEALAPDGESRPNKQPRAGTQPARPSHDHSPHTLAPVRNEADILPAYRGTPVADCCASRISAPPGAPRPSTPARQILIATCLEQQSRAAASRRALPSRCTPPQPA